MALQPIKLVRPDPVLAVRGAHVLIGGPEPVAPDPAVPVAGRTPEVQEKVDGFLAFAEASGIDITRQVLGFESDALGRERVVTSVLWVPAPGRTATLFTPPQSEFPQIAGATTAALEAALADAHAGGVVLVQILLEPGDGAGKTVCAAAGLHQLATLTYMERKPPPSAPDFELPHDFVLRGYCEQTHELFRTAILASYEETLDCPLLAGQRDIEDILAGHKSVGRFDPNLWSVVMRFNKPVGCLLLSEIPARNGLELVYLGLAPAVRGQGLGRILMQRVLAISARRHFEIASLAVDAANVPAAKLYRRCGYASVAQRVAMIRKLV